MFFSGARNVRSGDDLFRSMEVATELLQGGFAFVLRDLLSEQAFLMSVLL